MRASVGQRAFIRSITAVLRTLMRLVAVISVPETSIRSDLGRGTIIVANHRSLLDLPVALLAFRKWGVYPHFFVREDLFTIPAVAWILKRLGGIPAGPSSAVSALRVARRVLQAGGVIGIMPEGRIPPRIERVQPVADLMPGTGRLAAALGTPILVVGMVNSDTAWPSGSVLPRMHLRPTYRPTITLCTNWLEVKQGSTDADVMSDIRRRMIALLLDLECLADPRARDAGNGAQSADIHCYTD